jgi:hypothetical protein
VRNFWLSIEISTSSNPDSSLSSKNKSLGLQLTICRAISEPIDPPAPEIKIVFPSKYFDRAEKSYNEVTNKESDKRSNKNLQDLIREKKAYGAKQLKVNDLNNTAFSQNLSNTPSPNAANAFIQPQAEINQVARQIPQERRQETINTKRSHKKSVGPVKTVEPPMLYEMKPPPPRSTFNTKNDFADGTRKLKSNKVKRTISAREQSRKEDSTMYAQNAYSAAKRMELENEGKGKNIFVTEKRSKHKNYGKKTKHASRGFRFI